MVVVLLYYSRVLILQYKSDILKLKITGVSEMSEVSEISEIAKISEMSISLP